MTLPDPPPTEYDLILRVRIRPRLHMTDAKASHVVGQVSQVYPGDWIADGGDFGTLSAKENGWLRVTSVPAKFIRAYVGGKRAGLRTRCRLTMRDTNRPRRFLIPKGPLRGVRNTPRWRRLVDDMYDRTKETLTTDVPSLPWPVLMGTLRDARDGSAVDEVKIDAHQEPAA